MNTDDPFAIDENNLDEEVIRQPQLTRKVGVSEADARHAYAKAKAKLDVVAAQLALRVRLKPDDYGLPAKPTVDSIEATVVVQESYQKMLSEMNEAKYALDIASVEVTACLDRRKMLEERIQLLTLDYHAEREPQGRTPAARTKMAEMTRRNVRGDGITLNDG